MTATVDLARPQPAREPGAPPRRPPRAWVAPAIAPAVAGAAALAVSLTHRRGVDLPAQLYRVAMFHRIGWSLWDPQWYGGHWNLSYSMLLPPVAATVGVTATMVVFAALAALAFDRLVVGRFGTPAAFGSVLFAIGMTEQLAIGQLAFLMGEALALCALWSGTRRRWTLAVALVLATALASPLAAAFLALAALAWLLAGERRAAALLVAAVLPVAVMATAFPDLGHFPYPFGDLVFELIAAVVMFLVAPRAVRPLRIGAALYVVATIASFVAQTPVGGNVSRLGECVAIPLGACALWPRRRLVFVVLAIPMAIWQWTPFWGSLSSADGGQASAHRAYYTPLLGFLAGHATPAARVEVVPTKLHWEADYVATVVPLARGWERQIDSSDDPLFYGGRRLEPAAYRAWLIASGVRYVALPDAPLDYSATAEASALDAGVPGLTPVWSSTHWRVFEVQGSPGIVSGPARLDAMDGSRITLSATGTGTVVVRTRGGAHWAVEGGPACVAPSRGGLVLETTGAGVVRLRITVSTHGPTCR